MTLEQFVKNHGLCLVEIETTRTVRRQQGSVKAARHEVEHTCFIEVPGAECRINVTARKNDFMEFLQGVSRESREDARRQFVENIRNGSLGYMLPEATKLTIIDVPLDLE